MRVRWKHLRHRVTQPLGGRTWMGLEEAARQRRLREYETKLSFLWESQWDFVNLSHLPNDIEKVADAGSGGGMLEVFVFRRCIGCYSRDLGN